MSVWRVEAPGLTSQGRPAMAVGIQCLRMLGIASVHSQVHVSPSLHPALASRRLAHPKLPSSYPEGKTSWMGGRKRVRLKY